MSAGVDVQNPRLWCTVGCGDIAIDNPVETYDDHMRAFDRSLKKLRLLADEIEILRRVSELESDSDSDSSSESDFDEFSSESDDDMPTSRATTTHEHDQVLDTVTVGSLGEPCGLHRTFSTGSICELSFIPPKMPMYTHVVKRLFVNKQMQRPCERSQVTWNTVESRGTATTFEVVRALRARQTSAKVQQRRFALDDIPTSNHIGCQNTESVFKQRGMPCNAKYLLGTQKLRHHKAFQRRVRTAVALALFLLFFFGMLIVTISHAIFPGNSVETQLG